jgi:hypothetical protein
MVVVGDDEALVLVQEIDGPTPSAACWAPFRFTGRDLRTGRTQTVVVPQSRAAEVLAAPERVVEFVCRQGGELLLWDAEAGEVVGLPAWLGELPPNTPVVARFYQGRPVWLCGPAQPAVAPVRPRD